MVREDNGTGYSPGHPWYYLKGGAILSLKEIRQAVIDSGYRGYMLARLQDADAKVEPTRSETLRALRSDLVAQFHSDASRYRQCARALRKHRADQPNERKRCSCQSVHQNMALKHNHLFNDFATLGVLADMLSRQRDLFDL